MRMLLILLRTGNGYEIFIFTEEFDSLLLLCLYYEFQSPSIFIRIESEPNAFHFNHRSIKAERLFCLHHKRLFLFKYSSISNIFYTDSIDVSRLSPLIEKIG